MFLVNRFDVFFRSRRGRLFGVSASFRFRACRHSTRASGLVITSSKQRCRLFGAERDAAASSLRDARHACASSARPRARARARADTRARGPRKLPQVRRVRRPPPRSRVGPIAASPVRRSAPLTFRRCVSIRDAERDVRRAHSARHRVATTASPSRRDIVCVPSSGATRSAASRRCSRLTFCCPVDSREPSSFLFSLVDGCGTITTARST